MDWLPVSFLVGTKVGTTYSQNTTAAMATTATILIISRKDFFAELLPRRIDAGFPSPAFGSEDKQSFGFPESPGESLSLGLSINLFSRRQRRDWLSRWHD